MGLFHRVVLAFVAAVAVVFAVPSPASAHGTLGMSNPADGATVSAPVASVELFFTEKVPDNAYFTITAPGGGRVDNGWEHASPRPLDKPVTEYFMEGGKFEPRQFTTGFPARVRIAHLPSTGEYRVAYQSKASDGDAVHGTVTFNYTGPATPAPAGWTPPTNQAGTAAAAASVAPAAPAKAGDDDGTSWLGRLGGAAAVVVAIAGLVFWRRRAPGGFWPRGPVPVVPVAVGAVVVALIGGYALGRATAPAPPVRTAAAASGTAAVPMTAAGHQHNGGAASVEAAGTTVSSGGYTLQPVQRSQPAGHTAEYAFRIVGADSRPATRFAVVHEQPLHLIVASRDLGTFQHLHPTMSPDGLWSVPLTLPRAGAYRVFADFTVATGDSAPAPLVLGVDHLAPGAASVTALPPPSNRAEAGPFTVTMEGTPQAGSTVPISFRVSRSGAPGPATLEPYLGAYGHLVVLREGDLGYVHVHPDAQLAGGAVRFNVSVPGSGRYRAFLEFQVAGKLNRAEFTLDLS